MGCLGVARPSRAMECAEKPCFRCKKEKRLPASSYCRGCYNARKTSAARAARKAGNVPNKKLEREAKQVKLAVKHDADVLLPDRNDKTLTLVREIGFDSFMSVADGSVEKIFFLGPQLLAGRAEGAHATADAIAEFIAYWENQIQVARDYVANGRNNKTCEWK